MIKAIALLQIVATVLGCAPSQSVQEEHRVVTSSSLVSDVVNTLAASHRLGSLLYEGNCTSNGAIAGSFRVGALHPGSPPLQALHDAFANEPRLTETEDASGRIRVVGGNVRRDLLDLRLPQVNFTSEDNPRDATVYVITRPEVRAYMHDHRITFESAVGGIAPMPKGARLNTTFRNVTISEALDRIANTFPGVWIYGECSDASGERIVDFRFIEF